MTTSDSWDAAAEVASCPLIEWSGRVWRAHRPKYGALEPGGSRRISGRYNCGANDDVGFQTIAAEVSERWCALYLVARQTSIDRLALCRQHGVRPRGTHQNSSDTPLALESGGCVIEVIRHTTKDTFDQLNHRLTEIQVEAFRVLDCSDPATVGLTRAHLFQPRDYRYTHKLALAAIKRGAEAILVPSATGVCDNLIYFPEYADERSSLTILRHTDPPYHLD